MGNFARKMKKLKKGKSVSAYGEKAYTSGYNKGHEVGVKESFNSFISQVNTLKEIEGIDQELFDKIVDKLKLKGLLR